MGRKGIRLRVGAVMAVLAAVSVSAFGTEDAGLYSAPVPLSKSKSKAERGIASYSDQEILKNENEKVLTQNGLIRQVKSIRFLTPAGIERAMTSRSCTFGPKDYWYAFGLDGGCGVNAGNMAGKTNADIQINQKIACTLNVNLASCQILGGMGIDGLNSCNDGTGETNTQNLSVAKTGGSNSGTLSNNICLSPAQLEKIKTMMLSLYVPPKMRLLKVVLGGYPGVNCAGGWGADVFFGTCGIIHHNGDVPSGK
ncbi:MAG: hypothetical protein HYW49_00790 [Deltaproteobacteria bacterium]|nr:hypothetical protein [Deltaproteobacteria bacterium]